MNSAQLIGNLTRDPKLRFTPNGTALCKFGMAVSEKYGDKETTAFIDLVAWGKTGEIISEYFHKGDKIAVNGRLTFSSWETDEGQKRNKLEVTVEKFDFTGGKKKEEANEDISF